MWGEGEGLGGGRGKGWGGEGEGLGGGDFKYMTNPSNRHRYGTCSVKRILLDIRLELLFKKYFTLVREY